MIHPPAHAEYRWRGGTEWMLAWGDGTTDILLLPPLFEEANFLRAFLADLARTLAAAGCTAWLPDLPGLGDSTMPLEAVTLADWADAADAARRHIADRKGKAPFIYALRGGGLLVPPGQPAFVHAPVAGEALLREMNRAETLGSELREPGKIIDDNNIISLIGYTLSPALHADLQAAPAPAGHAMHLRPRQEDEPPLWRRIEPGRDLALATRIAGEITTWIALCAAR